MNRDLLRGVKPRLGRLQHDSRIELNLRPTELAGIARPRRVRRATMLVSAISTVALIILTLAAVILARSILIPVQELVAEALRAGDFDRGAPVAAADELGELARVQPHAEALVEFRRSDLGKVLRSKKALEVTIAALADASSWLSPMERASRAIRSRGPCCGSWTPG